MDMKTNLGDKVRDRLSGYEGIVTAVTSWLYGCRRITIQSQGIHEGKPFEPITVDEPQVEILSSKEFDLKIEPSKRKTGGPLPFKISQGKATPK